MPQFLKDRLRDAAIILAFAAALTFFGVYSTDAPNWATFLMWVVTCLAGGLASRFVVPLVFERHIAGQFIVVQVLVAAALIALPVLLVLYFFSGAFGIWIPAELLPMQYLYVYAVCLAMTVLGVLIDRAMHKPAEAAPGGPDAAARFLDRLPVKYRTAELWAVSSEDHYLRVHTSLGEELILMRLADAVRDLAGAEGAQTHRSWWVAKNGVADIRRDNGKLVLVLRNGNEAPVSRTFQAAAKDAGIT
ncbi:MAG: LytTR family DNA-binding domain-containing protein [Hyphomonas sp.]|uniref:LytTR family DNA-binding domain-containing protein n=1 Tax=Hyphomonas sp. TaxID=87 RepID=UPI00352790F7